VWLVELVDRSRSGPGVESWLDYRTSSGHPVALSLLFVGVVVDSCLREHFDRLKIFACLQPTGQYAWHG
jgi:hypothetical protein